MVKSLVDFVWAYPGFSMFLFGMMTWLALGLLYSVQTRSWRPVRWACIAVVAVTLASCLTVFLFTWF